MLTTELPGAMPKDWHDPIMHSRISLHVLEVSKANSVFMEEEIVLATGIE